MRNLNISLRFSEKCLGNPGMDALEQIVKAFKKLTLFPVYIDCNLP